MNEWWNSLNDRERMMLGVGGGFFVLCILYFVLVDPLFGRLDRLRSEVPQKRIELAWMRGSAAEVGQLRGNGQSGQASSGGGSVMAVIDQTAKKQGLGNKLKRIEPEGETGAKVWLEDAGFDDVMRWAHLLDTKHGIRVAAFSAEPLEAKGYVKARITVVGRGE
jgi:general secretion pathway protein M